LENDGREWAGDCRGCRVESEVERVEWRESQEDVKEDYRY
jgi:hypothetical protein